MATDPASVGGFTPTQLSNLTSALTETQNNNNYYNKLFISKDLVIPCDGINANDTRLWLRQLDNIFRTNNDKFVLELAHYTSRNSLLEAISNNNATTWEDLKKEIVKQFLTGAEDLQYRQQLTTMTQKSGETIQSYTQRYKTIYNLAYPVTPGAVEEQNALGFYLRGLSDQNLAKSVFTKLTEPRKLLEAFKLIHEKAQILERYKAITLKNVNTSNDTNMYESFSLQLNQISTKLAKLQARDTTHGGTPKKSPPHQKQTTTPPKQQLQRRHSQQKQQQHHHQQRQPQQQRQSWSQQVMCYRCGRPGHVRLACSAYWHVDGSPLCQHCHKRHKTINCRSRHQQTTSTRPPYKRPWLRGQSRSAPTRTTPSYSLNW